MGSFRIVEGLRVAARDAKGGVGSVHRGIFVYVFAERSPATAVVRSRRDLLIIINGLKCARAGVDFIFTRRRVRECGTAASMRGARAADSGARACAGRY